MKKGFAVDVGTTNLEVSMWNLHEETCISRKKIRNCLCSCGADIVSRILYARRRTSAVLQTKLLAQLADVFQEMSFSDDKPERIVFTGNTAMLHFLRGLSTEGFERAPFTPVTLFGCKEAPSSPLGNLADSVLIPPCIDAFLGADIVCAGLYVDRKLICSGAHYPYLVIDIGTNTEILLVKDKDHCVACSTAAGPAFEGWGLSVSMQGSALVSELARMLNAGIMDETGYILENRAAETPLNQNDVRNLQLAKGAVCAAVETLLDHEGMKPEDVRRCFVCGNFGNALDGTAVRKTGLLPEALCGTMYYAGNAALSGAELMLLNEENMNKARTIAAGGQFVQLADSAFFADDYIRRMNF